MNAGRRLRGASVWLLGSLASCSGGNGGRESPDGPALGEPETATVSLRSTSVAAAELAELGPLAIPRRGAPSVCQVTVGATTVEGSCATPTNVSGVVSSIAVARTGGGRPSRLFGSTLGAIGLDRTGELEVFPFDFATATDLVGSSNLPDDDASTPFDSVIVLVAYLDLKLEIEQAFWTVRLAFVTQPLAEAGEITDCITDASYLEALAANSVLRDVEGNPFTFASGDLLVCQKATADEACLAADFRWLDMDTLELVDTRPATPRQHPWAGRSGIECTPASIGYDLNVGGYDLWATISPLSLSAEYDRCLQAYTHEDGSGTVTGNSLAVDLDFDVTDSVFFEGIGSLDGLSDGEIAAAVSLRQIVLRDLLPDPAAPGDESAFAATAAVTVTDDASLTCDAMVPEDLRPQVSCTPDGEVRVECAHQVCQPDFQLHPEAMTDADGNIVEGPIWSSQMYSSGGGEPCELYCTRQSCDDYQGAWASIYCIPEC